MTHPSRIPAPPRRPLGSATRELVVYALIVVVLGGNLASLLLGRDWWPYNRFAMFSGAEPTLSRLVVVGRPCDPDAPELWFRTQGYLGSVPPLMIEAGFRRVLKRDGEPGATRLLSETLDYYRWERLHGRHDGPAVSALQLYRFRWDWDPYLRNLRSPHRTLIASYPDAGERCP